MIIRNILFATVVLLMPSTLLLADNSNLPTPSVYSYGSFAGGRITIDEARSVIFFGDYGVEATFCGIHSEYFCVNAPRAFYFAVPKHIADTTQSWTVDGHKYELVSAIRSMMILGSVIPVVIISTTDRAHNGDTATTYFYYSPKIGLIGFQDRLTVLPGNPARRTYKSPDLYVLNEKVGFGATK